MELSEGVIAAKRHIHATPEDAQNLGVADKEIVKVKIDTNGRSLILMMLSFASARSLRSLCILIPMNPTPLDALARFTVKL